MTHSEQSPSSNDKVVTFNHAAISDMQIIAEREFGKSEISDLTLNEASLVVTAVIRNISRVGNGIKASSFGRVVIDAEQDGEEALASYGRQMAHTLASSIDAGGELVIKARGKKTLGDFLLRREAKVSQTYRFRNEPPQ